MATENISTTTTPCSTSYEQECNFINDYKALNPFYRFVVLVTIKAIAANDVKPLNILIKSCPKDEKLACLVKKAVAAIEENLAAKQAEVAA